MKVQLASNQVIITLDVDKDTFKTAAKLGLNKFHDENGNEEYTIVLKEAVAGDIGPKYIQCNTTDSDNKLQCVIGIPGKTPATENKRVEYLSENYVREITALAKFEKQLCTNLEKSIADFEEAMGEVEVI